MLILFYHLQIEYDYRQAVKKAIPHLKTLDDEILIEGVGSFQKHNVFDDDWAYLEELQNDVSLRTSTDSLLSDSKSGLVRPLYQYTEELLWRSKRW